MSNVATVSGLPAAPEEDFPSPPPHQIKLSRKTNVQKVAFALTDCNLPLDNALEIADHAVPHPKAPYAPTKKKRLREESAVMKVRELFPQV